MYLIESTQQIVETKNKVCNCAGRRPAKQELAKPTAALCTLMVVLRRVWCLPEERASEIQML